MLPTPHRVMDSPHDLPLSSGLERAASANPPLRWQRVLLFVAEKEGKPGRPARPGACLAALLAWLPFLPGLPKEKKKAAGCRLQEEPESPDRPPSACSRPRARGATTRSRFRRERSTRTAT